MARGAGCLVGAMMLQWGAMHAVGWIQMGQEAYNTWLDWCMACCGVAGCLLVAALSVMG